MPLSSTERPGVRRPTDDPSAPGGLSCWNFTSRTQPFRQSSMRRCSCVLTVASCAALLIFAGCSPQASSSATDRAGPKPPDASASTGKPPTDAVVAAPDVIVVGAGISGLAAALDLGRGGARVTVVDMASVYGGHAVMSQGAISIVATPEQ